MFVEAFDYKRWADLRTLNAIEEIDKVRFFSSLKFILQQINHMVIVEELFKARLLSKTIPHKDTNSVVVPELNELKKRFKESNEWYLNFVSDLNMESTQEMVSFVFVDGKRGSMTIMEILFHIVNHGSYHRGSIAHALDLAQVAHPIDGFGIYIHEKEPKRRDKI